MRYIRELRENENVVSYSRVRSAQTRFKKNGEPYLQLVLADRSGSIEAKLWDKVDEWRREFGEKDFVKYKGTVQSYNGGRQLILEKIRRVGPGDHNDGFNERDMIPCTPHDIDRMWERLGRLVEEQVSRASVRELVKRILDNHQQQFKSYPAGTEIHHNYWGGFLEHVLSVVESCLFFADKYPALDRDVLVAGAVLHDIGKMEELGNPESPTYTTRGVLVGHIVLGRDILLREAGQIRDFPEETLLLLEHMILSHQGQLEWGSPKRPKIPEALILHYVDDLDAKLNRIFRVLDEDEGESSFTSYDRYLGRAFFKTEARKSRAPA
jgi:3'-5' exoribonuclease